MTSVLVSVYNAERTLHKCLDSLLAQTLSNIQIICIDDASTDSSRNILKEYASRHSNINLVFLSENHGQGYARNQGIPLIRGEYTAFLDSDDYMEATALESVEHIFEQHCNTDCVVLNVQYEYQDGHRHAYRSNTTTPKNTFEVLSGYDAFKAALTWEVHGWYVARSELYRNHPFDDSCHSYSDDNTTMEHYLNSREVRWCDARYFFVQHPNSCTHGISTRRFDWMPANESLHNKLIAWGMSHDIIDLYEEQRYYVLLSSHRLFLRHRKEFTPEQQCSILKLLRHAWENINTSTCLPASVKYKPFYMPLHPFWLLFHLEQKLYTLVRNNI